MRIVSYTDTEGFTWAVMVPNDLNEDEYYMGIAIGPPDLHELGLSKKDTQALQRELVKAQLINAALIRGSTSKLYQVVQIALPHYDPKRIVQGIKSIYQRDYYSLGEDLKNA